MEKKAYIGREETLNAICKDCDKTHPSEKELCPYKFCGCMEYYNVFELPSADVVPWSWLEQYATGKRFNYASEFVEEARKEWEQ